MNIENTLEYYLEMIQSNDKNIRSDYNPNIYLNVQ